MNNFYDYNAVVLKVVDADSVHLSVDLGFDISTNMKTRLYGINAPELSTPEGKLARDMLTQLLPIGTEVVIRSYKDRREKYGRYLVTIHVNTLLGMIDVNDWLVRHGYAVHYMD